MNINLLNFSAVRPMFYKNNSVRYNPRFTGGLRNDVFETSKPVVKEHSVVLKNAAGMPVSGVITEKSDKTGILYTGMGCTGRFACNAGDDSLYLEELYGEGYKGAERKYKGAGTEILKLGIRESIKRGRGGRIDALASGSLPFYFKNNFIFMHSPMNDAVLQYAVRNNIPAGSFIPPYHADYVFLNKEGAKALLEDRHLYKERSFEKIDEQIINGVKYSTNLIQAPYKNKYFLLAADEDNKNSAFVLLLALKENDRGRKYFSVENASRNAYFDVYNERLAAFRTLKQLEIQRDYGETEIPKIWRKIYADEINSAEKG